MQTLLLCLLALLLVWMITSWQLRNPQTGMTDPHKLSAFYARLAILVTILAGLLLSPVLYGLAEDYGWLDMYWRAFGFLKNPLK